MAEERLPFLRGRVEKFESFVSPRGGGGEKPALPPRDPATHRGQLLAQLDAIAEEVAKRDPATRDPEASRETIVVIPEPGSELPAPSLGDARSDVRVVGADPDSGAVIVDAPGAELAALRQKIDEFADASRRTPQGHPKHAPLIAPIHEIRLLRVEDAGPDVLTALADDAAHWVELGCRGSVYDAEGAARSRRELGRQLHRLRAQPIAAQFTATSQVIFYAKLTIAQLRDLLAAVDCVHEIQLAEPKIRDWLFHDYDEDLDVAAHVMTPPQTDRPAVVLFDSGVHAQHPLLAKAMLTADTVIPGVPSPVDVDGHGTQMAGVALHLDGVGDAVQTGTSQPPHWIQSVKITSEDAASADESARAIWAPMTIEAVARAEAEGERRRVYAMAVTAKIEPLVPTNWSQAIDQLAYDEGRGRVICISAGNAESGNVNLLDGYPQLNLLQPIQDPAQAWNALTVGAFTARDRLPESDDYAAYEPVAAAGGISPHSSARPLDADRVPNKPDVVFEGGNVAFDGVLPNPTVPTLTALTTGHRPGRPLASIWATSEAAARAGHLGASIWSADPSLRPETVRGLIVHASSWTPQMTTQFESLDDRLRICGYGVPDGELAIACTRERATVIVEDTLPNAIMVEQPRKEAPKRASTPATTLEPDRIAKFFRLPLDDQHLLEHDGEVELRVTLSYFAEVQTYRRRAMRGLDLRWDMQGPQEDERTFRYRVNKRVRESVDEKLKGKSFGWDVGPERRARGTVQSDRWRGPASYLAGAKLIAVMPVLGWWNRYTAFRTKEQAFSLIVTVSAPGLDIYTPIELALKPVIELPAVPE
ncbi:MAG: S8 family peptidase [Sandaracinaceae bacterium]|nr:S8 family peptidase [Sandaracinaceae bacterium]